MIAVIFEVWPACGHRDTYLGIAADLRPELEKIDGFISIERFESISETGKMLSLSFWRDESAIREWRSREVHRAAQVIGRDDVFADYRLRIAEVVRDYGMNDREQAPSDSRAFHQDDRHPPSGGPPATIARSEITDTGTRSGCLAPPAP